MKCPSCGYENSRDAQYCNLCQKSFVSTEPGLARPAPPPPPRREAMQAARNILRGGDADLNWFQRHLNWTWVLPQLLLYMAFLIVLFSFITSMGPALLMNPTELSPSLSFMPFSLLIVVGFLLIPLLMMAAQFGIGAWVLKRKERSLMWLLIFLVPSGAYLLNAFLGFVVTVVVWIVFLRLENRNFGPELPVSSRPSGLPGSSGSSSSIQPGLAPPGLGSQYNKYGP